MRNNESLQYLQTHPTNVNEIIPEVAPVSGLSFGMIMLALAHPLLALAILIWPIFATAHILFTVTLGLSFALFSKDTRNVGFVAAYVVSAELLWRMTNVSIFWELGKYFTILILGIGFLRTKTWQRAGLPVLYFLFLGPSIPLTVSIMGFADARTAISFNMSGPFALMISTLYFSQITLDQYAIRRIAGWVILPILGISTLVLFGTLSAETIEFTAKDSNFITSGGFGPNQVSAILGLGGGLAFLLFLTYKSPTSRWIAIILMLGFLIQSVLTFSRGGLYNVLLMAGLALVHSLRDVRRRNTIILILLVMGLAGGYLIFPYLNAFTGKMLEERFINLDTTRRTQIALADLELWANNPLLGVGPGVSQISRFSVTGVSHTEYTRVLAEHGFAGLLSLLILLWIAVRTYLRAYTIETQIWVSALMAWSFMEMSHSAMRVVAISFLYGLAQVNWEQKSQPTNNREDI